MKLILSGIVVLSLLTFFSCTKTSFIESKDALLNLSEDTLFFDTVFTSTGSVTQAFKIFNLNDKKLKLSEVTLTGGSSSSFKMNVDGSPGVRFTNIELAPNDSVYVFITVKINPSANNLPFIVQDSILISYNGNRRFMQLQAYGQNAHFLKGKRVTSDTTWLNDLPYVILDSLSIDAGATLTIEKGCKIYHHANAPLLVNGSLHCMGDSLQRIIFAGDRLDPLYKDLPGSWPGIFFRGQSDDNLLEYTTISNAYQGIIAAPSSTLPYAITLNQCIINNISDAGLLAVGSSLMANNCLISNCGANIYLAAGGNYSFNHCTVVSIGNVFIDHKTPVLTITDKDNSGLSFPLSANFTNSLFYGDYGSVLNEIVVENSAVSSTSFSHCLYSSASINLPGSGNLLSSMPEFVKIDADKRMFDFHLKNNSPAKDAAANSLLVIDLDGKKRPIGTKPDIGCYEVQ